MTDEQVAEIRKTVKHHFVDLPERHQKEFQESKCALLKMQASCDHRNPDGSNAIAIYGCKICGRDSMKSGPGLRLRSD